MKEWRSKYNRISKTQINQYISELGTDDIYCYFVVEGMLCTVNNNQIFWAMIDDENMYLSIIQYLQKEKVNIFDSIEEFKKHLVRWDEASNIG